MLYHLFLFIISKLSKFQWPWPGLVWSKLAFWRRCELAHHVMYHQDFGMCHKISVHFNELPATRSSVCRVLTPIGECRYFSGNKHGLEMHVYKFYKRSLSYKLLINCMLMWSLSMMHLTILLLKNLSKISLKQCHTTILRITVCGSWFAHKCSSISEFAFISFWKIKLMEMHIGLAQQL